MSLERLELVNRLSSLASEARITADAMDDYAEVLFEPERNRWRCRADKMWGARDEIEALLRELKPKETESE